MNFSPVAGNLLCEAAHGRHFRATLRADTRAPQPDWRRIGVCRVADTVRAASAPVYATHDAEFTRAGADLAQEIWVAIFRALPGLSDASKFRPWAFRIARDRIYREYRRRKLPVQPLEETNLEEQMETDEGTDAADLEELRHCLDSISPQHREALLLRFFEDMSYEEIARVTGATVGTVRSRIHYGKHALRLAWKGRTS